MLAVSGLGARYGRATALEDVSFQLGAGEVLAVMGRNGAGKSTTLKTLIGLVRPAAGSIRFDGTEIAGWEPYRIARAGLGYVPEERRIFAELTVLENLEVGRRRARHGSTPWTPDRLFVLFPNLAELRHRPGAQMSGGEQQMLTIARTLMGNPRLILLDEPSEGLAPVIVQQMARAISALKQEGVTMLMAEQNFRFASAAADHAIVLERGQVAWSGRMTELAADETTRLRLLAL